MKKLITISFATLILASCAVNPSYNQTIVSTKSYDFTNKNLTLGKQVIGRAHSYSIGQKAHKEAVDDAISRNNCTVALINVKSMDDGNSIEGTEVIDPTLGNCAK